MKSFVAFAALVAIAVASPLVKPVSSDLAQLEAIVAAIQSPSTNPATAALLEQQLQELIAANSPIAIGPAIVPEPESEPISIEPALIEPEYEPISIEPALVDFPVEGAYEPISIEPALVDFPVEIPADAPVEVSPVAVAPGATPAAPTAPLVQIILNINQAAAPVETAPVGLPPVNVVELPPVVITEPEVEPTPVQVVDVAPTPVQVVETAPVAIEPVIIGTPVLPSPAVVLPEELN